MLKVSASIVVRVLGVIRIRVQSLFINAIKKKNLSKLDLNIKSVPRSKHSV